jgi:hypothetical protein
VAPRRGRDFTSEEVATFCMMLAQLGELAVDLPTVSVIDSDPKDDMVIASAIVGRARARCSTKSPSCPPADGAAPGRASRRHPKNRLH